MRSSSGEATITSVVMMSRTFMASASIAVRFDAKRERQI
jgi:hypothetical protein